MKVTRKQVIIGVLIIAVAVTAFFIIRKKIKDKKEEEALKNQTSTDPAVNPVAPIAGAPNPTRSTSVFPLKKGSKGTEVRQLQMYLLKEYGFPGAIDGDYGPQTDAFIVKYLMRNSISEDFFKKSGMDKLTSTAPKTAQETFSNLFGIK